MPADSHVALFGGFDLSIFQPLLGLNGAVWEMLLSTDSWTDTAKDFRTRTIVTLHFKRTKAVERLGKRAVTAKHKRCDL